MSEIRTIRYSDGRWCEKEYVGDKLHGRWTVYFPNGERDWERQLANGRKEGYQRQWDEAGRLIEEQWFHLDELHGQWRRWDQAGNVEVVGDFIGGFPREALEQSVNVDFNQSLKPYFGVEPADCKSQIDKIVAGTERKTVRLKKSKDKRLDHSRPGSFWNHVNVLGLDEDWPCLKGVPLAPILQIDCRKIPLPENPLSQFSFVTVFANGNDVLYELGRDIVVRAYGLAEKTVTIEPPCDPIEAPCLVGYSTVMTSYPDENDLPPGVRVCLEDFGDQRGVLTQDEKLNSRIGGWPGWLQSGRISNLGRFAFQVDSLDVEGWQCGDCTIHYFFVNDDGYGFTWVQEMC
jgi:hypothetical protein